MKAEDILLLIIWMFALIAAVIGIYLILASNGRRYYQLLTTSELSQHIKDNGPVEAHEISQGEETIFKVLIK